MEYTVACNWDPELIDRIDYPEVRSVFGGLPDTIISGGRSSIVTSKISEEDIKEYIRRVHAKGWGFDYNVNSACTSNKEVTAEGFRQIMKYLDWICSLGVDSVTISNTNLIEMVKKNFPNLRIKVSTYQKINSVAQAKRFEDMGVDAIMLSEHINRDFKTLRAIREAVKCKLVLIANVGCVYNCPNMHTHANCNAHSGAAGEAETIFTEVYHSYCFGKRIEDISELVKIRWIRPEDVSYYEDIGIDMLKIIDRSSSTDSLAERMKAYNDRRYDGNLLNFLGQMMDIKHTSRKVAESITNRVDDEHTTKALRFLSVFSSSLSDLFYLDNQKLPKDFISTYANRDCRNQFCSKCGNCKSIASEAVTVLDEKRLQNIQKRLNEVRSQVMDGSLLY